MSDYILHTVAGKTSGVLRNKMEMPLALDKHTKHWA